MRRAIGVALRAASRGGYHRILARAWFMASGQYQNGLDLRRSERALRRAARHAALDGDPEWEVDTLQALAGRGVRSPMPVSEVMAILDRVVAIPAVNRAQLGRAAQDRAYLFALQGRFDEARELMVDEVQHLKEVGRVEHLTNALVAAGLIEFTAERYTAAREHFVASRDLADKTGQTEWSRFMAGRLAHIYMLEGDDEAALEQVQIVERAMEGSETDEWARLFIGGTEARVMARRGQTAEAVERARIMVADAAAAGFEDYPLVFAPALEDLAEVLAADGQTQEACDVLNRVIAIQRAKENVVGVAKAERALARIGGG
jgi:tetratricopeptide (TPR) repeat protein